MLDPSYFLILFENGKSKDFMNSRWKRIEKREFNLLVDKNIMELEAENSMFKIIERRSFFIHTTTELSYYVIIDGKRFE